MTAIEDHDLLAAVPHELLIGGAWRPSSSAATLGRLRSRDRRGDQADRRRHARRRDGRLQAADDAAPLWADTSARQRADVLRRAFDLVQERKEDFALLMSLEMGKPLAEARGEVAYGGEFLRWFSEEATAYRAATARTPKAPDA